METDFFAQTAELAEKLNQTERKLYNHVVKNMDAVSRMGIQEFAKECFVSTTTAFRFVKKLGFLGYSDFAASVLVTSHMQSRGMEKAESSLESGAYIKNMLETVRVMPQGLVDCVTARLHTRPHIYILADDNAHAIGQYVERLFIGLGLHAYFPETAYQRQNITNRVRDKDMLIALSYSGLHEPLLEFILRVFLVSKPFLLSVTKSENNRLEALSDANFYIFCDTVTASGVDISSCVNMLVVVELLVYAYIASKES